jgi:hypothetical protein
MNLKIQMTENEKEKDAENAARKHVDKDLKEVTEFLKNENGIQK